MAVVWGLRVAIALGIAGSRYVISGGSTPTTPVSNALRNFARRLGDPGESPSDLTAALTASAGEEITVTDFTGTFELRKLAVRISRAPTGGTVEDQDVLTFHFIKASAGTPGTYVDGTDLPAVETAFGTYFNSLKTLYPSWMHLDQYRWYKDGPAFYTLRETPPPSRYVPLPAGNPAIRVTEVDVAGTFAGSNLLPPQVAYTITERCSARIHWGRYYVPAGAGTIADAVGRIASGTVTAQLAFAVTFYNACRAASMLPVVWSIQKPERAKRNGALLPAAPAVAYEVTSLQMDDLFDIIRRRRYSAATVKPSTTLT